MQRSWSIHTFIAGQGHHTPSVASEAGVLNRAGFWQNPPEKTTWLEPSIDAQLDPADALDARELDVSSRPSIAGPWRWTGLAASALIAASAPLWRLAGNEWRFSLPLIHHDGRKPYTTILFLLSAGVLALSWILLVRRVERSTAPTRARTRAVVLTGAMWFVPVLLGPPLLSSDVYSYAAQGEMVTKGLDPTSQGMFRLQTGEYVLRVDPIWRRPVEGKPEFGNGYGPVQMGSAAAAVSVTGHHALNTVWALKVLALLGVALAGWGLLQIAREVGLDPPTALALGILNPIVALHVVGGGHNDGLLMGLLFAGVALALRAKWWWWGVVLIAMAASVKLPAIVVLPYLAWCRPGLRDASRRERLRSCVQAGAVSLGVIAAWSVLVGVSFGWVNSMRNAGSSKGTLAITTQLGYNVSDTINSLGLTTNSDWWIGAFRLLGVLLMGGISLWLLWHSERITPLRAAGIASLAMVVFGPVVWPWYFAAPIALLAVTELGRWRASLMLLTTAFACEVFPSAPGGTVPDHNHLVSTLVILGIALAAVILPWAQSWWAIAYDRPAATATLAD
ncbi:MAG: polyprenol phosphomannose-dependent alpha 1,6 mannosyltransferase MptB [Acidimicrobiales bacterium]